MPAATLLPVRFGLALPGILLAALVAILAPAAPALVRYGSLPRSAERPLNIVLAGVTPVYPPSAVWPYPPAPEDFSGLTDTIMLAQVRPDGTVKLLSVPRDTWVNIAGYGMSKINAANPRGGPELLMNTLQDFTGLQVDGYALLSLHATRAVTDAAGGVVIDVPKAMKYDDNAGNLHIDLQPGVQRLNGEQLEGFLRFRKDSMSDIGRIGRQQQFVTSLVNQTKNPLNWWRVPLMVGAAHSNAQSDLTRDEVGALLGAALHGPKVSTFMVPGDFGPRGTWVADQGALNRLLAAEFSEGTQADEGGSGGLDLSRTDLSRLDPATLRVNVVNQGAPAGSAGRLADQLRARGFTSVSVGNGPQTDTTVIQGEQAQAVQQALGFGVADPTPAPGSDLTIRLGTDLQTAP